MRWYDRLYTGKLTAAEAALIREKIERQVYPKKICLITLAVRKEDIFDIREAEQLKHSYIKDICPLIVGLAADRDDALSIITGIVDDCYRKTGNVRIREYLGV